MRVSLPSFYSPFSFLADPTALGLSDKKIRTRAVSLCMSLYLLPELSDSVEECSLELLSKLELKAPPLAESEVKEEGTADDVKKESAVPPEEAAPMEVDATLEKEGDEAAATASTSSTKSKWTDDAVIRFTDLYFSLCKTKPVMLNEYISCLCSLLYFT